MSKLQTLGEVLLSGKTPHIIVNTFDKAQLQNLVVTVLKTKLTQDRVTQIQTIVKMCSYCHLATPETQELCDRLLALQPQINASSLIFQKFYASPELIPQQYISVVQEKLLPSTTAKKYSQHIIVHYLLDQVVGFAFEDGTEWYAGNRVKV
jgi:hypothetical protein